MRSLWLASYPKSGSTWFRILLANLGQDRPVDINRLPGDGGIASARTFFDDLMLFPSGLLTHEECERLRPLVHEVVGRGRGYVDPALTPPPRIRDTQFIKTHDAWLQTPDGVPLMGGRRAADGAILIVRDPRDVAASLAHHMGADLDTAIDFLAGETSALCGRRDFQPQQLRQRLTSWSGFNASWLDQQDLPVLVIRYEDIQRDPVEALIAALNFAGLPATPAEAEQAAGFATFETLRDQEQKQGFREAAPRGAPRAFFRRGVSGGWRDELTADQVARIEQSQLAGMLRHGYP
ncbi:MAG: sulfotransferase domain-containing protein [Caulobacter sp.]|nr:sulfotransferase domain-containing protein [Caulobacter sp.]